MSTLGPGAECRPVVPPRCGPGSDSGSLAGPSPFGDDWIRRSTLTTAREPVGFDLDMTLIDSRPGIAAAYRALTAADRRVRRRRRSRSPGSARRCGTRLRRLVPGRTTWRRRSTTYRALYPAYAIEPDRAAARRGRGAWPRYARPACVWWWSRRSSAGWPGCTCEHLGLAADEVAGDLFAEGKATALTEHGVRLVRRRPRRGHDRRADRRGARASASRPGPCDADELRAAGAHGWSSTDLTGIPGGVGPAWSRLAL